MLRPYLNLLRIKLLVVALYVGDLWSLWGIFGTIIMFFTIKMSLEAYTMARGGKNEVISKTKLLELKGHELGLKQSHQSFLRDI